MQSLFDPAVLFFLFGVLAGLARSNLEIPPAISKFLSLYLLMALGLKGGFALSASGFTASVASSLGLAVLLAVVVPLMGYALLRRMLSGFNAAAVAATYGSVSAVTFAVGLAFLQDKGLCGDVNDFFSRIFTKEHDLGFPVFPSIKEVVDAIHAAGGVALCAHAASSFHGPGLAATLLELAKEDFDGFECYHSGHSREDTAALLTYCRQHQLLVSGGSDCHGSFVPSRALGQPVIDSSDLNLPGLL